MQKPKPDKTHHLLIVLEELRQNNWLINNLSQLDQFTWRASLRNANYVYAFGEHYTPEGALLKALANTAQPGWDPHDKRFPFGPKMLSIEDLDL